MRIISASRRTDIPAFYSDWFMERIRAGHVRVMSPFSRKVFTVSLKPEDVTALVFWTKNARPLAGHISELRLLGYPMYFLYTVNNYPKDLEPYTPELRHTIETIEMISDQFDCQVIRWRYDPVVVTRAFNVDRCLENFDSVCSRMKRFTRECIFSPCDHYRKTVRKMTGKGLEIKMFDDDELIKISTLMAEIASTHGVSLFSCAHDFLVGNSVGKAECIDSVFLKNLVKSRERLQALANLKKPHSRNQCACVESVDIGAYNTCFHDCVYCYATQQAMSMNEGLAKQLKLGDCLDPRSLTLSAVD